MIPIVFISIVSLTLVLMLYWVTRSGEGRRFGRTQGHNEYQFEAAQELFKYVDEDVYLGENNVTLLRPEDNIVRAIWNLSSEKWQELCGSMDRKSRSREPYLRLYQAGEHLKTIDMILRQKSGHYDFDLAPQTSCYCSIGYKENGNYYPLITSRTIMRQC